jgi:ABC-type transport system involved in multi-copper enzyme maturation permease subunit
MTLGFLHRFSLQNPVLAKDLMTRMRGAKAFTLQGIYVGILLLMMVIAFLTWWLPRHAGVIATTQYADLGRALYMLIFETQVGLAVLITPALTASAITIEHEQRTYELLACTRISPRSVIVGKLLSGWLFIVMLLTCSLPMAALCLMFGGVSLGEILWSYVMLCLFALFFASLGVLFSSLLQRTVTAVIVTYSALFFYNIVTLAGQAMINASGPSPWGNFGVLNPFVIMTSSQDTLNFFSLNIPYWLPGLIFLPLGSLLFLNWAIGSLPNFPPRHAGIVRILAGGLFLFTALLGLGDFSGQGGSPLLEIGLSGSIALLLLSLVFATGEMPATRPPSLLRWLLSGISPRKMFSRELRGGWSYLLLLALLLCGLLALANRLSLQSSPPGGAQGLPLATFAKVFAVLVSALLALSALGALGGALNSRPRGIRFITAFLALTQILPGFIWASYQANVTDPLFVHYSVYLAPYASIAALLDPAVIHGLPALLRIPGAPPIWVVTVFLQLLFALGFLMIAEGIYRGRIRRLPPPVKIAD